MLPYVRFVLGAALALSVLGAATLGLFASVRIAQQAKVGPLESSRSTPFDDRADWNQFNDPEATRRFEELTRKAALADAAAERAQNGVARGHDSAALTSAPSGAASPPAVSEPPADISPPAPPRDAGDAPDTAPTPRATMAQPGEASPAEQSPAQPAADQPDAPRETGTVTPAPAATDSGQKSPDDNTADEKTSDGKASAMASWDEEPLMVDESPSPGAAQPAGVPASKPAAAVPARGPIPHLRTVMRERAPLREATPRREEREAPEPARAKPRVAKPAPRRPPPRETSGDDFARQQYWQSGSQQYAPRRPAYREPFGDYGARSNWRNGG
jgi:hypothetical protein